MFNEKQNQDKRFLPQNTRKNKSKKRYFIGKGLKTVMDAFKSSVEYLSFLTFNIKNYLYTVAAGFSPNIFNIQHSTFNIQHLALPFLGAAIAYLKVAQTGA